MFEVAVNTRRAIVEQKELITTHSAGLQVHFTFSDDWDDLSRFAIFRNGEDGVGRTMLLASSNITIIPPEVCAEEYIDEPLFVGVYGTDGVGAIAIPTVWVSLGVLREGATTDGIITPEQPTPDMWAQMYEIANEAVSIASECEDGEEERNAAEEIRQSNEEQRQQNEIARQTQFNQLKQNAIPYVLEPSASVIVYNPDAPAGQRISPTTLSVDAYRIDSDGDRGGYTADVFWYTCIDGEGIPVAAETEYSTTGIYVTLPQTITDEATVEFYIQKNPEIGLPDTLARITVPIIKAGTKGDPGDDGFSPEVTITEITDGHRVTITDEDHPQGQSFDVMDGANGDDGYSPAVTITEITGGHRVTITDETHPSGQTFDVMDGVIQSVNGKSTASITLDSGDIEFDDSETYAAGSIGAEVSNQKNAISQKAPLIINTASGDVASFADGADGMQIRKIVGTIVPVQSGTGDPAPDNVRPISGWTGANITATGKNLLSGENVGEILHNQAQTLPINWQTEAGTIYGGTVTLNEDGSVDVVRDMKKYVFDGTLQPNHFPWSTSGAGLVTALFPEVDRNREPKGSAGTRNISDWLPQNNINTRTSVGFSWYSSTGSFSFSMTLEESLVGNTKESLCAYLSAHPLSIVYVITNPDVYHFDNIGELYTYLGTNNVWIDTGSISECDYPADTKLYIDGLTEPDEDMIANANIASGKYFVVNNQLYLSTAAIAAGASIVPGTNCTATNLAEALNALNT